MREEFGGEVIVGVDDTVGMCVGKLSYAFGADFEVTDRAIAKTEDHVAC